MKLLVRILVPVAILSLAVMTFAWLMANRPEPQTRKPPPTVQAVDAIRLKSTNYQVIIPSFGAVTPRTKSTLKPEVSGRVMSIANDFRAGGFFETGDVLLTIDPRDYETAVVVARATLAQRQGALELEKAQHEQAKENWKLLGDGTDPNPLTLREPQLAEAMANVESATARLAEAKRNLEKTEITAPYPGRVQSTLVDVGQYVSPGNTLAEIFAVDYVEVRLPLNNDGIDFLKLPEDFRGDPLDRPASGPKVVLKGDYGSRKVSWEGRIVRADGQVDLQSRQLFVVAQVDDPYARSGPDNPPLRVGNYLAAEIYGSLLDNVFVIPRSAVRDGKEVLIIDGENALRRRPISILWKTKDHVVVTDNLRDGEILCTTPMSFAADGATVVPTIDGVAPVVGPSPGGGGGGMPPGGPGKGKSSGRK